ncbi:hypothetical protein FB645_001821 [Coemansia sp. IMI 203386]|nr:hypothetical protein FB645_001821 [Coemansia sp. IMI 203386]
MSNNVVDDQKQQQQQRHSLMRSLYVCERQLEQNTFTEPLDPTQVRRLTNIERLLSDFRTIINDESPELNGVPERFAALEDLVAPWIEKKNDLLASLLLAQQSSDENDSTQSCEKQEELSEAPEKEQQAASFDKEADNNSAIQSHAASRSPSSMPSAHVRRSSIVEKRAGRAVPDSVEGVEKLLKSQRATQDDLSSDLVKMAGVLKKNSLAFSDLVEKDKVLVQETTDLLDTNTANLEKHGGRLTKYRKRAWGTTGVTWLAVLVVVSVFFMLVLFMRVAPKRY